MFNLLMNSACRYYKVCTNAAFLSEDLVVDCKHLHMQTHTQSIKIDAESIPKRLNWQ